MLSENIRKPLVFRHFQGVWKWNIGIKLFETFLLQNGLKTKPNLPYQELYFSTGIFELPILPKGKELLINIKTTWGDRHYVGLNGIEVFSDTGNLVKVKHVSKTLKSNIFDKDYISVSFFITYLVYKLYFENTISAFCIFPH